MVNCQLHINWSIGQPMPPPHLSPSLSLAHSHSPPFLALSLLGCSTCTRGICLAQQMRCAPQSSSALPVGLWPGRLAMDQQFISVSYSCPPPYSLDASLSVLGFPAALVTQPVVRAQASQPTAGSVHSIPTAIPLPSPLFHLTSPSSFPCSCLLRHLASPLSVLHSPLLHSPLFPLSIVLVSATLSSPLLCKFALSSPTQPSEAPHSFFFFFLSALLSRYRHSSHCSRC
ncbi:hypothetical protein B0O80DRAFT_96699 [Mortierella sp. GBAus27b]|nr:hypothetical protein B0O80DRAFT_96699 [Mortierella sp. GBAus27b]